MKDTILFASNNSLIRLFFGFIMSATLGAPFINQFSDSVYWLVSGIALMLITLTSLIYQFKFTDKNKWIIASIILLYLGLVGYLFFRWG